MAKDAVDSAVKEFHLEIQNECVTDKLLLEGGEGWNDTHYIRLAQEHGIETEVIMVSDYIFFLFQLLIQKKLLPPV